MRSRSEIVAGLTNPGIIAVMRAPSAEKAPALTEALIAGGVTAIEITLTTKNAREAIREVSRRFGDVALIGAGTVLTAESCRAVCDCGAEFVVSPVNKAEIAEAAHAASRPVMLGAYTPTEAQAAHECGSDFIKIFPADGLGPGYIKALLAPLPHLRIVPTGGVDVANVAAFIKAGCVAVGVGSSLIAADLLRDSNWPELTRLASQFVAAIKAARTVP